MRALDAIDPRRIGPFDIVGRLGAGAMGTVYLARSPGGRPVAVKIVAAGLADDPGFRERFRREVEAARRVGGFWTAAVVDADPDASTPWLASEYVAGPTVQEAVAAAGPLPESTVRQLAAGLAEALAAIHATGLVHRDVKPSNVLLAADGPRLIDFGISRALDHSGLTAVGQVFGTPGYTAPEQVAGAGASPAGDVFSLGAVLVFAVTGAGPFGNGSRTERLRRTLVGTPDLAGVPAALRAVVEGCLHPDPGQRMRPPDLLDALRRSGGASASSAGNWLPDPVRTMVTQRAGVVAGPSTRHYTAPAGPVRGLPVPTPRPPDTGGERAVFLSDRRRAWLLAGLALLGVLWGAGLSEGGPGEKLIGAVAVVGFLVLLVRTVVGAVRIWPRVTIDGTGIGLSRRGRHVVIPWRDVARVGVGGADRGPWLVVWLGAGVDPARVFGTVRFPRHHGGVRVYRVGAWRWRRARYAEAREMCAALSWYAGPRFDPRL